MSETDLHAQIGLALKDIRRFAYGLTGNVPDADDLLQTTVMRLLEKGVPEDVDIRRWGFRVCKNIWIDMMRAKKTKQRWLEAETLKDDPVHDGQADVEGRLHLNAVGKAMEDLPDDQRLIIALIGVDGMSYREASDHLQVPVGTIMSRLARARASLLKGLNIQAFSAIKSNDQ